ncbi:MAG: outer membrane lipoprotein-sorting protein [Treponema sp.]|nr:outer membrane lipoprotein-sorting protein [Treponema sp.]
MKKNIFYGLVSTFFLISNYLVAQANLDMEKLLQAAEDNTAFYGTDFRGAYRVIQSKPGEGASETLATMYRRDDEGKWTILISSPSKDKGKGYLQFDNNIWFYDPADRRFTFTSAKDKFQDTNANNSDFMPQHYARDYEIDTAEKVKLGSLSCVCFSLKAKVKNVDYPGLKIWVTINDGLVRKKEDYSFSGQKLRTTLMPKYQIVTSNNGREYKIPVNMSIQDNLKGKKIGEKMEYERTVISISNAVFAPADDSIYTKAYLEMMSVK